MNDETMQDAIKAVLSVLSKKYPDMYRADGLNPMSNRVAGYIMNEIVARQKANQGTWRSNMPLVSANAAETFKID